MNDWSSNSISRCRMPNYRWLFTRRRWRPCSQLFLCSCKLEWRGEIRILRRVIWLLRPEEL